MKTALLAWLVGAAAAAVAAERPADYASGMPLDADGRQALYEVKVPAAVYRGVTRADLGDVRVFNGADEPVPYAWRPRRAAATATEAPVSIPLFALWAPAGTPLDGLSISVRRGADGSSSVDVRSSAGGRNGERRILGYLADLAALERPLRAITLEWQNPPEGHAGRLKVEASDDLHAWRTLVASAPLVDLEMAGQRLLRNRVELRRSSAKFLRLSWLEQDGAPGPQIVSLRGEPEGRVIEPEREWARIESAAGSQPGEYLFDAGGLFPLDRVRLHLPQPNTVAPVEILSRPDAGAPWRSAGRAVAYRLRREGGEMVSPDIAVRASGDRYWMLRVDTRGGGLGSGAPVMVFGWIPHALVFAARGEPPFQLAFGNRQARPASLPIATLIPGYSESRATAGVAAATPGASPSRAVSSTRALAPRELGGPSRLREPVDWKRWTLWGALVLGVLVLGAMAWRLMRQLDSPRGDSGPRRPDGE